jgi:hypothetical protein
MPKVTEIAPDVYRISVFFPEINLGFNHFLIGDDEPILFHTGLRRMYRLASVMQEVLNKSSYEFPVCAETAAQER